MSLISDKYKRLSENNRIIVKNVFGAFVIKGLALIVSLITLPAYLHFFNNQVALGLWYTILSVLTWILNFDLGIGNGLRNKLTQSLTERNFSKSKKYLSSAYISIAVLCILISSIFIYIFNFIDWNRVFNIKESIVSERALLLTVKIVFLGIILQMFFKLITSVLYAIQKSAVNNLLSLITSILTIVCVIVLPSKDNDTNMVTMALVHVSAVIIPLLITTLLVFRLPILKSCVPSFKYFSLKYAKKVLALGGVFLFIQVMYMFIMNTNEYLITLLYSNEAVVEFQIYFRIFTLVGTLFTLAMTPIWSAITKAYTEKNILWIKKLNKRILVLAIVGSLLQFLFIPFLQPLINIWLGQNAIIAHIDYAIPFALLGSLLMFNGGLSSVANGIGELRTQTICFSVGAVLKIILSYYLVHLMHSWIGVVWANVISLGIYCIVQPICIKKFLYKVQ